MTDVTLLRDSLCLGTFAQGFIMLLPRSSLAITIQGFKKYNLAAKRTFNNLVKCCICSLLDFTWILSSENCTTCHYNLTVLYCASTWITFTQIQAKLNNQLILTRICVKKQTTLFLFHYKKSRLYGTPVAGTQILLKNIRTFTIRIEFWHLQYTINYCCTTKGKN